MYGKHFESMYTGSMMGQGALGFAVWGYVIAHVKDDMIELNPKLLAALIGEDEQGIQYQIDQFCQPDPHSRTRTEEGKRLVRMGEFAYRVVNARKYRAIRDEEERREYQRNWDREHRPSGHERSKMAKSDKKSDTVRQVRQSPTHTETETETETDKKKVPKKIPTIKETVEYFITKESTESDAKVFHEHFSAADWHDKNGRKIRVWKQNAASWIRRSKPEAPKKLTIKEKDAEAQRLLQIPEDKWTEKERNLVYAYNGRTMYYDDGGTQEGMQAYIDERDAGRQARGTVDG